MVKLDCINNTAVKYPSGCTAANVSTDVWEIKTQSSDYCTWRWVSSGEYQWPECIGKEKPDSWPEYGECLCQDSSSSVEETESLSFSTPESESDEYEEFRCYTEQWYDVVFNVWRKEDPAKLPMECKDKSPLYLADPIHTWIFEDEDGGVCTWRWWGRPLL